MESSSAPGSGENRTVAAKRVLGVDPGTVVTGWGVVEGNGTGLRHVASGIIRLRGDRAERLGEIHRSLYDLCMEHRPTVLIVEKSFVGENVQSAFRLGEARGAVMVAAVDAAVPVLEYSPAEIKLAVTGNGRADKRQVQIMVAMLLDLQGRRTSDEADALATAICHLHSDSPLRRVHRKTRTRTRRLTGVKGWPA